MTQKKIILWVTVGLVVVYAGVLTGWHVYSPERSAFTLHEPGADNRPEGLQRRADDVIIGEYFMRYSEDDPTSSLTGKWDSFRGPESNNIVTEAVAIDTSAGDFPVEWSVDTGEGHAAPVIYNGRAYFLDYDEGLNSDALRCFSLETGEELWRRWYRVPIKRNHGFSRTVPVIGDDYIITIGPQGHVMCCDPVTGDLLWTLDMQKEYGTEIPPWYTGQCPLVDGNTVILAPGGTDILMAGVDCLTGEVQWSTPNTAGYGMSHSSVMPMTLGGKKTYVYAGLGGVCGVSAEEADRGALLWENSRWQPSVISPSPLQLTSNTIFLVAGYGTGGALLQVDRAGSSWNTSIVDQYKPNRGLSSEQQTPILYNNMIISVLPNDGGGQRGKLVCYALGDIHASIWESAADERFGYGPYIIVNNHLFVFKDDGELYLYEVENRGMKFIKKQRVIEDGADAWGPIAYADGRLIVRDAHTVKCLRIAT